MSKPVTISLIALSIIDWALVVYVDKKTFPHKPLADASSVSTIIAQLLSQVGGQGDYVEQLYTFSFAKGQITVAYLLLIPGHEVGRKHDAAFFPLSSVVGRDERTMLSYALQRLKWKVEYTNVVYSLLPDRFTLTELQKTYEVILGKSLDKRNFRKKILSLGILKATGAKRKLGVSRPAEEYQFKDRTLTYVEVL